MSTFFQNKEQEIFRKFFRVKNESRLHEFSLYYLPRLRWLLMSTLSQSNPFLEVEDDRLIFVFVSRCYYDAASTSSIIPILIFSTGRNTGSYIDLNHYIFRIEFQICDFTRGSLELKIFLENSGYMTSKMSFGSVMRSNRAKYLACLYFAWWSIEKEFNGRRPFDRCWASCTQFCQPRPTG